MSSFWGTFDGAPFSNIRTEQLLSIDYDQSFFENRFGISESGSILYGAHVKGPGLSQPFGYQETLWLDDALIAAEGTPFPGLDGTWSWRFSSNPRLSGNGTLYWIGGLTQEPGSNVRTAMEGFFTGTEATPLLLGGDTVTQLPSPLAMLSTFAPYYAISGDGTHYLMQCRMETGSQTDDSVIVVDGSGLLVGQPLTLVSENNLLTVSAAIPGERWERFRYGAVNDSGAWALAGETDASAANDEVLILNGSLFAREGQAIGGVTPTNSINAVALNNDGDLSFIWHVDEDADHALFMNDDLILRRGDFIDTDGDGVAEFSHRFDSFRFPNSLYITDHDIYGLVTITFAGKYTDLLSDQSNVAIFQILYFVDDIACDIADMTGSSDPSDPAYGIPDGDIDAEDFFYFMDRFAEEDPQADLTGSSDPNDPNYGIPNGVVDSQDFFFYMDYFAIGCPSQGGQS